MCYDLKRIYLSDTVCEIGKQPLYACTGFEEFIVDENSPFFRSIDEILFNKEVTKLVVYPFNKICEELTVPESVEELGFMSFYCYPDNIKKLNLGPNVRTISENALHYCDFEEITVNSANPYFVVENNCLLTKDGTTLVRAFNIKDELVIPDTITKAYLSALNGCMELKKLSIPASLTEFDEKLITELFYLEAIEIDENNPVLCSVDGIVFNKEMTRLIDCHAQKDMSNGYVVPDTVEEIADSAFIYNETLSYIVFPPSLRTIGEEAFLYNSSLSCVEFNDNLESIGARAFCDCASLRRICLGSGKNLELGPYAFQYCEPELLYVPSGLEDITMYFTSFDVENFSEDFVIVTDRADSMFAVDICPDYGIEPVIDPDFTGPHKASEPKSENQVAPGAECAGGYDTAVYCEFCGKELSRNHTVLNAENVKWKENSSFSGTVYPNFIVYMRAELENMPDGYSIVWYDESGKEFEEKRMAGSTAVTEVETEDTVVYAKVFDENGNAALDSNGNEIVNKCEIKVKTGFFAGLIGKIAGFLKLNKAGIDGNKCVYGRKMISIMLGLYIISRKC